MLGSLTSLTGGGGLQGGSAGPSSAGSSNDSASNIGFQGGTVNMGSNNGVPTWALVLGGLAAWYVLKKR